MHAAVEAARALPFPFTLTARAENLLHGRNDLDDTIKRLQAFEAAGADVLYSPGVHDIDTIRTVVSSVGKPFNLVMGFADPTLTVEQLSAAGVKRISVGGAMARVALAGHVTMTNASTGAFTYAPNPDVFGVDSFTFTASDQHRDRPSCWKLSTVTMSPVNDAPVASESTYPASEDTPFQQPFRLLTSTVIRSCTRSWRMAARAPRPLPMPVRGIYVPPQPECQRA